MKEPRFRAFNEITGKMFAVHTICGRYLWDNATDLVYDSKEKILDTAYDSEDNTHLMQYTGLKAKNGDIYEGDIVRYQWRNNPHLLFTVVYGQGRFGEAYWGEDVLGDGSFLREGDCCEIIGNIYENPELIKGSHDQD